MAEADDAAAQDGRPAVLADRGGNAGLQHPFRAGYIHDLQIAAIVHMAQGVEVMGQHAEPASGRVRVVSSRTVQVPEPDEQQA